MQLTQERWEYALTTKSVKVVQRLLSLCVMALYKYDYGYDLCN